jgi:thioredoxin reductase
MQPTDTSNRYDVAIVGGGPAGLSAAIVLARACRRIVLFDHGKPRNYAAEMVNGFLGLKGISPEELRERGRREASSFGVKIIDGEVTSAKCRSQAHDLYCFFVETESHAVEARALLLATGVKDYLPEIAGLETLYGSSVHHCPYCDGWEHRGKHLVALANGASAVKLAIELRAWSNKVTACSNGENISTSERQHLANNEIQFRSERVNRVSQAEGADVEINFHDGSTLTCEAVFFGGHQRQRSKLPELLGCEFNDEGLVQRDSKQKTCVDGLFVAGDAAFDVQFAIVAAAEGAVAATAINRMLIEQETR